MEQKKKYRMEENLYESMKENKDFVNKKHFMTRKLQADTLIKCFNFNNQK